MTIPARSSIFSFICLLIGFMLLGMTRSVFADETIDAPTVGGYALDYCLTWATDCGLPAADAYCKSKGYAGAIDFSSAPNSPTTMTLGDSRVCDMATCARITQIVCSVNTGDGGDDSCAQQRSQAESQCGGPDLYVIDEATCEWHCDDSQDCPDSDDDGAADVCDPCPENPAISEYSVQIYRLNGDSMSEKCGQSTMSCDGSIKFEGNTGTICQAAEVKVTGCRAIRGSGSQCKADKDTDGDGTYNSEDEDDDNDGKLDSEDADDDGDGILDVDDKDHEDYSDYDNDGTPDYKDTDDDNDGVLDAQDKCPRNADLNCDDADGDGTPNSEDTDDDGDGIPDSEDPDANGDGIPDADQLNSFPEPSPFTLDLDVAALFQKYLDRFSQFLASMRQTSVFSIPNQVLGGIPSSGGSSVVTISTGETFGGDHQIDFSGWASGLAVIRGVLYAVFTALAVRIIILKR